LDFRLADLAHDREILEKAREEAENLLKKDPDLQKVEQAALKSFLQYNNSSTPWGKIS
jgi:ATP-dependent DNA helicase RecG